MTYCLAIRVNDGLVFASDSRTHAGVDYANVYSKMHHFNLRGDRQMVLLAAGSLATTQAIMNLIQRDLDDPDAANSLNKVEYLFDAANYIGYLSTEVQEQHIAAMRRSGFSGEASFILGGQIADKEHEIYLIYPQGNYITASSETPFLQIGETKYGRPILDRIIRSTTSLEESARCALVSLDSTMRSNVSVGPPIELVFYVKDSMQLSHYLKLTPTSPFYASLQQCWNEGLKQTINTLPRFDWEQQQEKPAQQAADLHH